MTEKDNKPHLLIIRLSAMGDVAMAVPVAGALRAADPGLRITILTDPLFRPLFRGIGNIEFLDADLKGRHRGVVGLYRLRNDIGSMGVTHVADLQDTVRTRLLRRMLVVTGKKAAVADDGRDEKRELTRKFRKLAHQLRPTVERYADTVRELGFTFADPTPAANVEYPVPQEIAGITGPKKGAWIGVAPFARHKGKIYPTNLVDELIGLLARRYERVFVIGEGPYEQEFAEHMEQRHPDVVSAVGKVRLGAELDLLSNLDAVVTMDSAVMHMASLAGVPAVSVWGATHPHIGSYGFGQDPANAVQLDLHCRPCSVYGQKPCMYRDYRCLAGITPRMIADRVAGVLGEKAGVATATGRKAAAGKKIAGAKRVDTKRVGAAKVENPAEPAGKPAGKPAGEFVGKPAGEFVGKPVGKAVSAGKPTGEPAAKSAAKPEKAASRKTKPQQTVQPDAE